MTRIKTLVVVGVMVLLVLAATVGVFAASPWGPSADNRSDFNGVCPRTGQSTEFCLGQSGGERGQSGGERGQFGGGRGQSDGGRGQGNGLCDGTGNMMRQAQ